jgi:hypothetical protein
VGPVNSVSLGEAGDASEGVALLERVEFKESHARAFTTLGGPNLMAYKLVEERWGFFCGGVFVKR